MPPAGRRVSLWKRLTTSCVALRVSFRGKLTTSHAVLRIGVWLNATASHAVLLIRILESPLVITRVLRAQTYLTYVWLDEYLGTVLRILAFTVFCPFYELEILTVRNVPWITGRQYYIHRGTWQAFCYCARNKKWYDVSHMRDWKRVCERDDFLS